MKRRGFLRLLGSAMAMPVMPVPSIGAAPAAAYPAAAMRAAVLQAKTNLNFSVFALARQLGIEGAEGGLLPGDKAERIQAWQAEGKVVAMVGDGINDSQALAQADISMAMGQGSDIAMDVARMTLVTSDLLAVPRAIRLSRMTVHGIRQNLFWAFVYNLIGIPIAAGVLYPVTGFLLDPMLASAAMALSSVSVVSNSLRLRGKRL